jgi:nickel transport protein
MKRFVLAVCLCLICLSLTIWPSPALAHSVLTDYRLVADALEVQSSYSTGEMLEGAKVVVYAPNDATKPWLEGQTDQQGRFQFQPDARLPGEWTVRIGETGDHGDLLSVPVTAAGIDLNEITQNPFEASHSLALGRQVLLAGLLLSGSLGMRWLTRWRRIGTR